MASEIGALPESSLLKIILTSTRLSSVPLVPEVQIHQASEPISLWEDTERATGRTGLDPPYWAFAWAGGRALARYVLDHPAIVCGRRVIDVASGSGLVAIAAAKAGAAAVTAYDVDPLAAAAIAANARANGVTVASVCADVFNDDGPRATDGEVVLVADAFYERDLAAKVTSFLEQARDCGAAILAGDFGRTYLPHDRLVGLATYDVPGLLVLEGSEIKRTTVWTLRLAEASVTVGSSLDQKADLASSIEEWDSQQADHATADKKEAMTMEKPKIVSSEEWQQARDDLLKAEKEATRALDAIAARRRRLPMVSFRNDYTFETPAGKRSLLDLFDNEVQLAVYQFMDRGPDAYCPGCTWFTNSVANLPGLVGSGVAWVTVSDMPLGQIEAYKAQMGWTLPFVSSHGTSFAEDCGAGEGFMLSMFLRDGTSVYRTYSTTARGVDRILFVNNVLDLAPYGRQEDWEDSPPGWPQQPTYG